MDRTSRTLVGVVIGIAIFGVVIPFVGPLFDFGMGPAGAFEVTGSRVVRHVIPGLVVIAGAGLLLSPTVLLRRLGAALAVVAGGWFASAPFLLSAEGGMALARRLVYHTGTGFVLVVVAAYLIGRLQAREEPETVAEPSADAALGRSTRPAEG